MSGRGLSSDGKLGRREFLKTGAAATAALLTSTACPQPAKVGDVYLPAGTKKMAALLRRIYEQTDWKADPDKTAQRAKYYRSLLRNPLTLTQQVTVWLEMGKELLRSGENEEALQALEGLAKNCQDHGVHLPDDTDQQLHLYIALSYLRLGEQDNCFNTRGQTCDIFPIHGRGVHSIITLGILAKTRNPPPASS